MQNRSTRSCVISALSFLLLAFCLVTPFLNAAAGSSSGTLAETTSGLTARDPLTSGHLDQNYWRIYGDAVNEGGATYSVAENSSGMYLGVESGGPAEWAGIYTETPNTDVLLFHVDLTLRYSETSAAFNTGLYVQTFNGVLNYVTCYGQVGPTGHYWGVLEATGNTLSATNFVQLWTSAISTTGPSTEDCTIVTNGSNLLTVYMDGAAVYSSTNAGLNMPEPFNAYLEVESGYSGGMLYASYRDYYATTSDYVMVHNVPAGDTVKIVSGSQVLESTTPTSGTALLEVAQYELPLSATLEVLSGSTVVATTGTASIWAGDVYRFSAALSSSFTSVSSTGTSVLTVDSQNTLGNPLTGYYTALFGSSGNALGTGYTTATYTLADGQGYQIVADSYGSCTFSHWSGGSIGGSTADPAAITITGPTTVAAVYSGANCGAQTTPSSSTTTATGAPSVVIKSVNQNGQAITGYWTVLYSANGNQLSTGFTTKTFTAITVGTAYSVGLSSYAGCTFSHWSDTGSTSTTRAFTATAGPQTFTGVYTCT